MDGYKTTPTRGAIKHFLNLTLYKTDERKLETTIHINKIQSRNMKAFKELTHATTANKCIHHN